MQTTLLIMAAGIGSRFGGGIKQLELVGLHNEIIMTVGRCCYCGYEHELIRCERCNELVSEDVLKYGFCPACAAYIDKQ